MKKKDLSEEVHARKKAHEGHSCRNFVNDKVLIGLAGEVQFEKDFGLPRDKRILPGGDDGFDFTAGNTKIDLKVARKARYLFMEKGRPHIDVLVLGQFIEEGDECRIEWRGWELGAEMRKQPAKDFGYGVTNHYKPSEQLRPMSELSKQIAVAKEIGW